ncbi:hypothetical protein J6590_015804 [Homalodisca vitripennis]|nr:hypothetical protein J6590_015804 [Homalodisca vitripennis]
MLGQKIRTVIFCWCRLNKQLATLDSGQLARLGTRDQLIATFPAQTSSQLIAARASRTHKNADMSLDSHESEPNDQYVITVAIETNPYPHPPHNLGE